MTKAKTKTKAPRNRRSVPPPVERPNVFFKPDEADFPRTDFHLNTNGPAPYPPNAKDLECLFAAAKASKTWRRAIEDAAEPSGRAIEEIFSPVDDTCFALAVLDKVWQWNYYEHGYLHCGELASRTHKEWLVWIDEWTAKVYEQARNRLPATCTPPTLDFVQDHVRSCMALFCDRADVCDPPAEDAGRHFDMGKLGRFASRYHDYPICDLRPAKDDHFTVEYSFHVAEPWPPVDASAKMPCAEASDDTSKHTLSSPVGVTSLGVSPPPAEVPAETAVLWERLILLLRWQTL